LDKKKEEKEKNKKNARKRVIMDDIVEIKAKKKRLEDDIETLTTSAEEYADQAESKGKVTLITKSNALRRSAKEKKETMGTIEKELEEKRNNYGTLSELIINVAAVDLF
jgi:isocitrate/isopropylmalate dehydrogenase